MEDNSDVVEQYETILKENNHQIISTFDGEDGWNVFSKEFKESGESGFNLVIIDYDMPVMNGVELSKKILDLYPEQRIVFTTAYIEGTLRESATQLKHVVEILHKPFELKTLIKVVENFEVYRKLQKINSKMDEPDEFDPNLENIESIYSRMKSDV